MTTTMTETTVAELNPNPDNPRTITEERLKALGSSLSAFGDIGGIVYNRRTKRLVGGHQRCKCFGEGSKVVTTERFEKADEFGTTAVGYVLADDGQKHAYREVSWTEKQERIAIIAANSQGGEWDEKKLASQFMLTSEENDPEESAKIVQLLGFEQAEMETILSRRNAPSVQEMEAIGVDQPLSAAQIAEMSSQVRMVQLFMTVETQPKFMLYVKELQTYLKKANITDTVFTLIKSAYDDVKFLEQNGSKLP